MKDLKSKLQKIYHWLKERPSTHIVAIPFLIYLLLGIFFYHLFFLILNTGSPENNYGTGLAASLVLFFYFSMYFGMIIASLICFTIEAIIKFNWKIKRKFLLENKIYNFFWLIGLISYTIVCCIVLFFYFFLNVI